MQKQDIESAAGQLYDIYSAAVGGKAWNGDPLPAWEVFSTDLAKRKQADGWRAVARAKLLTS